MISRADAIKLVRNSRKYTHVLVASTLMRKLAQRLGEDSLEWELVGWLHDLDVEETRYDRSKHGILATRRLEGKLPDHCLHAIKAHDFRTGFKPVSKLGKALRAVDSMYYVLAKEFRMSFEQLDVERFRGELERISLKRPWHRGNILGCEDIGLSLGDFLRLCVDSFNELGESTIRRI